MLPDNHSPVIGWLCSYVPEEIILAAGAQSRRITGDYQPIESADQYLPNNVCPFTRNILDQALRAEFDCYDGIIVTNSCLACEFLYDVLKKNLKSSFVYMLDVPRKSDANAVNFFKARIRKLSDFLAQRYNRPITDESLQNSIDVLNENREQWQQLYELRKLDPAPVSSLQVYELMELNNFGAKIDVSKRLYTLRSSIELNAVRQNNTKKTRLLLTGSRLFHRDILSVIEDDNTSVVYEDMCVFQRSFDGLVDSDQDLYHAISQRYLAKNYCARMCDLDTRFNALINVCNDYRVDGVIYHAIKYCSSNVLKGVELQERLKESGVPCLFIESDHSLTSLEQLRTRVNSFVEILEDI